MLPTEAISPEVNRRRALGQVYALLIRLAEENENQPARPDSLDIDNKENRLSRHPRRALGQRPKTDEKTEK
jgi:hypothetical protein